MAGHHRPHAGSVFNSCDEEQNEKTKTTTHTRAPFNALAAFYKQTKKTEKEIQLYVRVQSLAAHRQRTLPEGKQD